MPITPTQLAAASVIGELPDATDAEVVAATNAGQLRDAWVTPESLPARLRPLLVASGRTIPQAIEEASLIAAVLLGVLDAAGDQNPLIKMAYQRLATSDRGINIGDEATQAMLQLFGADVQVPDFTPEMAALVSSIGHKYPAATEADVVAARQYLANEATKATLLNISASNYSAAIAPIDAAYHTARDAIEAWDGTGEPPAAYGAE